MRIGGWLLTLAIFVSVCSAQPQEPSLVVRAARFLDVRKGAYVEGAGIWIMGDRIREAGRFDEVRSHAPAGTRVIDLGALTVLPGLIDCHTHLMARFANGENGYLLGLATKSQAFRALEGAADARVTLRAGFTSVRDVENEGSGYADVALRDAIEQGLVEGPRMQVATRAIAAVGQYNPFGVSPDLPDFPTGAQMISGVEEARRAVREQIGHGADLIKVYADWMYPTLTVDEIRVIVEEAHKMKRKVAAHATHPDGIANAVAAGVDSIEHGYQVKRETLEKMKSQGTFLVATVGGMDLNAEKAVNESPEQRANREWIFEKTKSEVQQAMELGVRIAAGFDASSAGGHGRNAEELVSLNRRGMPPLEVLRAATVNAAELMGWQDQVGALEAGKFADLIAVEGDPLATLAVLRDVKFVMKGGEIVQDRTKH